MNISFARPFAALRAQFRADLAAFFDPALAGLRQQLDTIHQEQHRMSETFSTVVDSLKADIAAQSTVIASATAAFQGLAAQIAAAEATAKAAGATDDQIKAVTDIRTGLEANTAALAAAIPANTPAATTAQATQGSAPDASNASAGGQGADTTATPPTATPAVADAPTQAAA